MGNPDLSGKSGCEIRRNPGHHFGDNHLGDLRNNPDSPFRIRTFSEIPEVMARISPHFTSGFSGQIRISHPDCFGDPRGDCPDFSASNIRINPDSHIRKYLKNLCSKQASKQQQAHADFPRISHPGKHGFH